MLSSRTLSSSHGSHPHQTALLGQSKTCLPLNFFLNICSQDYSSCDSQINLQPCFPIPLFLPCSCLFSHSHLFPFTVRCICSALLSFSLLHSACPRHYVTATSLKMLRLITLALKLKSTSLSLDDTTSQSFICHFFTLYFTL